MINDWLFLYPLGFILTYIFLLYYCFDGEGEFPTAKELIGILGMCLIWPAFWVYFTIKTIKEHRV